MKIELKAGGKTLAFDGEAFKKADWQQEGEDPAWTYEADEEGTLRLKAEEGADWWSGALAEVETVPGSRPAKARIFLQKSGNGDQEGAFVRSEAVSGAVTEALIDGEKTTASGLAAAAGFEIGCLQTGYASSEAAAAVVKDAGPCAVYILDRMRGFANEWTLIVAASEAEAEEIERRISGTERLEPVDAQTRLSYAFAPAEEYRCICAADKHVRACFASDWLAAQARGE